MASAVFAGITAAYAWNKGWQYMKYHGGAIGKTARYVGTKVFSENTRNNISEAADIALEWVPYGKQRTTLTKIMDVAKGKEVEFKQPTRSDYLNVQSSQPLSDWNTYRAFTTPSQEVKTPAVSGPTKPAPLPLEYHPTQ